ncbi:DAK2 domain-containing protein [Nocardia miyunensis]|uniref:DAK2 domain-containing protein n=1 Tax=Nocardia miyunensis TaxID=282684 RepID=UPI00082C62CB|nr:DAK2 domain-containing protein [Nocardia miyunensis]
MSADLPTDMVVGILDDALDRLTGRTEYLRELDAAVGDGDLGITVGRGAAAVREALRTATPADLEGVLITAASAFSRANPSTMAALVGTGLLAAAKGVAPGVLFSPALVPDILRAVYDRIAERGKADLGDKTVLDAIAPSIVAAANVAPGTLLAAMIDAAQSGLDATTNLPGRRGRAGWVGERGVGHPDPGAAFYVELLRAIAAAAESSAEPN